MIKILRVFFYLFLAAISSRHFLIQGVPVTHDGQNHLVRFANYKIAVRELHLPPRLAPNLVNGYGYPVFNYNYPLANIFSLPFSILNIHYEIAFKIIMTLSVLFGLVGSNFFLRSRNFSRLARIFALTVLAVNPYILTSIIFRGNIGEIMAIGILPWIFYLLEKIKNEKVFWSRYFFALTLSLLLLFLAHNIAAFFASILLLFYSIFNFAKNFTAWRKLAFSFAWAFFMALWFWLPAIVEKNLITLDQVDLTLNYYRHFPNLNQLLRLPIEFGYSYWGNVDSMSLGLGGLQLLILFLSIIYLLRRKPGQNLVFFLTSFILVLAQLPFSKILYETVPFADFIQFPWRLSLFLAITLLPLSALIFENLSSVGKLFLSLLLLLQVWQFWQVRPIDFRHQEQIDFDADAGTTSVNQENMPKSFKFAFFAEKEEPVFILQGEGQVYLEQFYGTKRQYQLHLESEAILVESTAFFPGWETRIDGQKVNYIDDEMIAGRLAYSLPAGDYQVKSRFTQNTWPRLLGNCLSAFSAVGFIFCFWQMERSNKNRSTRLREK